MLNIHDLISGGFIGVPLTIIAFVLLYVVFLRDTEKPHKEKQ
jgi:cytochrome bd-type quinol oxidase subunit 2